MGLTFYTRVLRNHWIAVTAMVLLVAAVAFAWSSTQPKVYAANASGFVTSGSGGDVGLENLDDMLSKSRAASYVELAKDRATAQLVIEELGLDTTASALVGHIAVAQKPETVIIAITARAGTPQAAQDLADAWVKALAARVGSIEETRAKSDGMRIEPSEAAELPSTPVAPQVSRNVAFGAILGAILGMGYAVARSLMDRRIRSVEDIEGLCQAPVAGTVLDVGSHTGLFVTAPGTGPSSLATEGMRRLRTNLSYMDVDNPPRALVITSPKQGDGKSTIAANLAATIALSGQQVTLIDADLRRPRIAELLELDDAVGLTDVLTARLGLADALQTLPTVAGFQVLTSGPRPPNPTEILDSNAMRKVIEELTETGMVIIDAPPLLPVTDAAVLALVTDGALVTVSTGRTLDSDLSGALSHLDAVHARALGVVLNKVSKRSVGASNYAFYGYDAYDDTRRQAKTGSAGAGPSKTAPAKTAPSKTARHAAL